MTPTLHQLKTIDTEGDTPTPDDVAALPFLRPVDRKRIDGLCERIAQPENRDTWYIHTVMAQCFLPYRDPKKSHWFRSNGDFSIGLTAGIVEDKNSPEGFREVGLPFGAKPRLFLTYVNTLAVLNKSPIIPVECSMTGMMRELGYTPTGGKEGNINKFKEQITRLAACRFRLVAPGTMPNTRKHINAEPFKSFDVWFANSPNQRTLWASEIVLTDDFYNNLIEHAIPYDFRGLKTIQNNARAQDVYLWMTQRLCRIPKDKPLFMTWDMLREMFGGNMTEIRHFPREFKKALLAARTAYHDARIEEEDEGIRFHQSPPPIPKTKLAVHKP
jgi:hypothetical protein